LHATVNNNNVTIVWNHVLTKNGFKFNIVEIHLPSHLHTTILPAARIQMLSRYNPGIAILFQ
jgi:hypothetical protein